MTGNQRFIGLNTEDKLGMLRRAWNAAPIGGNTLFAQLSQFATDASGMEDDDVNSSSSNSHSSTSQMPGAATATAAEKTRGWYQIIEGFQTARQFLRNCCRYGLDAFQIQCQSRFPQPLPAMLAIDAQIIVDTYGKWLQLCDKYEDEFVKADLVIGKTLDDGAIYLWLLANPDLLNITKGVTEQRGEFTEAIVGRTGGILQV